MTLASPSTQDSKHLLEKRHSTLRVMECLLEERLQMQRQTALLSLVGDTQIRIIIDRHVSQIYLLSLQFLHFVFLGVAPSILRSTIQVLPPTYPSQGSLKNAKHACLFPNSATPAAHIGQVLSGKAAALPLPSSFSSFSPLSSALTAGWGACMCHCAHTHRVPLNFH